MLFPAMFVPCLIPARRAVLPQLGLPSLLMPSGWPCGAWQERLMMLRGPDILSGSGFSLFGRQA